MNICLTIPGRLPSLNEMLRMHWAKRRRLKKDMAWGLMLSAGQPLSAHVGTRKRLCHVVIIVYQKTRRFDEDNLAGACKPVIDCLKEMGFIYRDSPKWLDLDIRQAIDHKNPRVEIEVEELT
jgi:Holliday junction resolvase RusA-like endonuclease